MKVFGIGLGKTGTSTLGVCLETLGYRVKGSDVDLTRCIKKGILKPAFEIADQYDGFQDFPWPLLYKEMDVRYPNSKFILTIRKNKDDWFDSLIKHANRTGPTEHKELAYGYKMPHGLKNEHISFYEQHNEEVRKYFRGRENDFLEVCWAKGDGWEEICTFLGHDIPKKPLPHANKASSLKNLTWYKIKTKAKEFLKV